MVKPVKIGYTGGGIDLSTATPERVLAFWESHPDLAKKYIVEVTESPAQVEAQPEAQPEEKEVADGKD